MTDILIRKVGRAGRITLNRPHALNALTYQMILDIEDAIDGWRNDSDVHLVIIDAAGEKAFCAGGDIADMYRTASAGDFEYGRTFWADEYRLNAKIAEYPKPFVAFMQGFTMGGGVGVSCHGSHRIVGETSRIAMPECGIGLVPDVGGSLLLARAPGRTGQYLGMTAARMASEDAIFAGFADSYILQEHWQKVMAELESSGRVDPIDDAAEDPPQSELSNQQGEISEHFGKNSLLEIGESLASSDTEFGRRALNGLNRVSPLSAAATLEMLNRLGPDAGIRDALQLEYRFTWRSAEHGDFVEGIRAAIIDKDNTPRWRLAGPGDVSDDDVAVMLAPIPGQINFEGESP